MFPAGFDHSVLMLEEILKVIISYSLPRIFGTRGSPSISSHQQ